MIRCLWLSALTFNALAVFSQTVTTINYAGTGLSQTSQNLFASPVWVDGYPHQTLIWDKQNYNAMTGPTYNGTSLVLEASDYEVNEGGSSTDLNTNVFFCQDAYSIGYFFAPNYTYTVTVNIGPMTAPANWPGANDPLLGMGITIGTPQYTTSPQSTGFYQTINAVLTSFDSYNTNFDVTYTPVLNSHALYSPPPALPMVATYLDPNSNSQSISTIPFTVSGGETGINIEAFASPWWFNGVVNSVLINSVSITTVPVILPNVTYVCSSETYSVNTTYPVTWSASPSGIVSLTPNGSSVTVTKISEGNVTLTATMNDMTASLPISTIPAFTSVTATQNGSCDDGYQAWQLAATPNAPSTKDWNWAVTLDNGPYEFTAQNAPDVTVSVDGRLELAVTYQDACGFTSQPYTVVVYSNCNEPESVHFDASPNPAQTTLEILPHRQPGGGVTPLIREIKVFDLQGRIRSDAHYGGTIQQQVSVSSLENGIYFVLIYMQDGTVERKKVLVQH